MFTVDVKQQHNFLCSKAASHRAYQNDIIKNFAVIMNALIKRVDCQLLNQPGSAGICCGP